MVNKESASHFICVRLQFASSYLFFAVVYAVCRSLVAQYILANISDSETFHCSLFRISSAILFTAYSASFTSCASFCTSFVFSIISGVNVACFNSSGDIYQSSIAFAIGVEFNTSCVFVSHAFCRFIVSPFMSFSFFALSSFCFTSGLANRSLYVVVHGKISPFLSAEENCFVSYEEYNL